MASFDKKTSNGQLLWLILQQRSLRSRQVKHSEATPQSSTANVYIRTSHHKLMGVAPQRWRQKDAKGAFQAVRKVDSRFFRLWHHLQAWQWHGAYRWLLLRELRISQFCICLPGMPLCCARCSWQDMLFKLKVGLRDSKLAHSWPPMRRKVCSLLPFLFWMVLFPNRTHPSGVAFLSHQRQSTNPMCASLRICFWLPKLREPFLKRFHLHTNFIVSSACNPPPDGSYICSVASMFEAGFSNDVCFNCNSKHYSGRAGRRKMTRTRQGLTTSHPLCERLFAWLLATDSSALDQRNRGT